MGKIDQFGNNYFINNSSLFRFTSYVLTKIDISAVTRNFSNVNVIFLLTKMFLDAKKKCIFVDSLILQTL